MGTVHDFDARRARPRVPAPSPPGPGGDVVPLVRRPTVEVTAAPRGAPPDGRVYVTVSSGGERCAVPLDLDGAARLARGLREVAEAAARATGRLVLLRPTAPGGVRVAAAPERGLVVGRRDGAVLLDLRSGRRAWFSTVTGEPVGRAADGGLRLSARDASRLRRAT